VAHSLRAKNSWVAYPCGFGLGKGGSLLIHASQTDEEATLCIKAALRLSLGQAGQRREVGRVVHAG
jgi:hypothetical protein